MKRTSSSRRSLIKISPQHAARVANLRLRIGTKERTVVHALDELLRDLQYVKRMAIPTLDVSKLRGLKPAIREDLAVIRNLTVWFFAEAERAIKQMKEALKEARARSRKGVAS
jgi:hypothetical protein